MSTIVIKRSATPGAVPSAGSLAFGEQAINYADKKIYAKDSTGTVFQINLPPDLSAYALNSSLSNYALNSSLANYALAGRNITGAGLATGGGNLGADRVITVPKATGAEVAAKTRDDVAVTPLGLASLPSGGGGGLVLLGTYSVSSGVIVVPLGSVYSAFRVVGTRMTPVTSGAIPGMRVATDGVPNFVTGTNYATQGTLIRAGATVYFNVVAGTYMTLMDAPNNSGTDIGSFTMDISNAPSALPDCSWIGRARNSINNDLSCLTSSGFCGASSNVWTHLQFIASSGNLNANAKVRLYGYAE